MDPSRCVILVPYSGGIEPECERGLRALEERGYAVRRIGGQSAIDQARSQIATDALRDGFDELFWIDSDVVFEPEAVDRLRAHGLPIVCGIYPKKGPRELTCFLEPETKRIVFGEGGGLLPIVYCGAGFLLTRRRLYEEIGKELPVCNEAFGKPTVPYFLPMVVPHPRGGSWYLGEDFAFCERARRAGFEILADTTIRLFHVGKYRYGWEEAGITHPRYDTFDFRVT